MVYRIKPRRVYVDTSVIGGCFEKEFREHSRTLVDAARKGSVRLVISDVTLAELAGAPTEVQSALSDLPDTSLEYIEQDDESQALAQAYLLESVVPRRMLPDALHIAIATVARVDVLVSWNFKHIVNLDRIHAFNAVNLRVGYAMLEIRSPAEVTEHGKDN